MLKIRLTRRGKKNRAFFRLVVAEHTSPIKGRFLEALGFWDPHTKEKGLKEDRIKYWLEKGAQCSDTAHNLLVSAGIIKKPKRAVKIRKKPAEEKKEGIGKKPEEAKAAENEKKPEEKAGPEEVKTEEGKKAEPARNASHSDAGGEKTAKDEKKAVEKSS